MEKHDIAELDWERQGERLKLKTKSAERLAGEALFAPVQQRGAPVVSTPVVHTPPAVQSTPTALAPAPVAASNPNHKQIVSPFVGTFYRAPSPEATP